MNNRNMNLIIEGLHSVDESKKMCDVLKEGETYTLKTDMAYRGYKNQKDIDFIKKNGLSEKLIEKYTVELEDGLKFIVFPKGTKFTLRKCDKSWDGRGIFDVGGFKGQNIDLMSMLFFKNGEVDRRKFIKGYEDIFKEL